MSKETLRKKKTDNSGLTKGQISTLASLVLYASEMNIDLSTITSENYAQTLNNLEIAQEKHIARDLHSYLTGKTDDYSDVIADYLYDKNLTPKKQLYHWTKTLSILRAEFTSRPKSREEKVDRDRLINMILNVYQTSQIGSPNTTPAPKVSERAESLLLFISRIAQSDYHKRLKKASKNFPKDQFLANLKTNTHNDSNLSPLTDKIATIHIQKMLESLESSAQDLYITSLRKHNLTEYIPKDYTPHTQNENSNTNNRTNPQQGDKTMADTNEENTTEKKEEQNTFKPSAIQQKACEYAGIKWEDFKDDKSITAAIENAGLVISGANIIDLRMDAVVATVEPETEEQRKEAEQQRANAEYANRDDGYDLPPAPKDLNVSVINEDNPQENQPTPPAPLTSENTNWIERKAAYFQGLSERNEITDYQRDETITDGFAASFNNAKIHYSSPDSVSISKDAGYKVFDVMLKDPDNQGRRVNFAENMPPEMAARLYAACIMNDNKMGGAIPQLTEEQKNMLKAEMGDQYAVFEQKLAEKANQQQQSQQTAEEQSNAKTSPTPESKKQEIKQAMKDQYEMAKMESSGKATRLKTFIPGTSPYIKGENCSDEEFNNYLAMQERAKTGKQLLLEEYKKAPEEFRKTMNDVISELSKEDNYSKISALRAKANINAREETPEEKTARRLENIKATQAALGIIESYTDKNGIEHKKLEGEDLNKFVAEKGISAYTYGNLGGKDAALAEKLPPVKEGGDAKADFAKGQAVNTARQTGGNEGR